MRESCVSQHTKSTLIINNCCYSIRLLLHVGLRELRLFKNEILAMEYKFEEKLWISPRSLKALPMPTKKRSCMHDDWVIVPYKPQLLNKMSPNESNKDAAFFEGFSSQSCVTNLVSNKSSPLKTVDFVSESLFKSTPPKSPEVEWPSSPSPTKKFAKVSDSTKPSNIDLNVSFKSQRYKFMNCYWCIILYSVIVAFISLLFTSDSDLIYNMGLGKCSELNDNFHNLHQVLNDNIFGQYQAITSIERHIRDFYQSPNSSILFIFSGDIGVGKSYTVEILTKTLFSDDICYRKFLQHDTWPLFQPGYRLIAFDDIDNVGEFNQLRKAYQRSQHIPQLPVKMKMINIFITNLKMKNYIHRDEIHIAFQPLGVPEVVDCVKAELQTRGFTPTVRLIKNILQNIQVDPLTSKSLYGCKDVSRFVTYYVRADS